MQGILKALYQMSMFCHLGQVLHKCSSSCHIKICPLKFFNFFPPINMGQKLSFEKLYHIACVLCFYEKHICLWVKGYWHLLSLLLFKLVLLKFIISSREMFCYIHLKKLINTKILICLFKSCRANS